MEFTLPIPLGAQASLSAQTPVRKPPDSTKVESPPDADKARAHMHNATKQSSDPNDQKLASMDDADEDIRPDTLAGPPPTFQINVLEMEQKLQQQLARIEADRARSEQSLIVDYSQQPIEEDET